MDTQFTPGPWEVHPSDTEFGSYHIVQNGRFGMPEEEDEANARLIEAAPEMVDALERIQRMAAGYAMPKVARIAQIAIAKAKGDTP